MKSIWRLPLIITLVLLGGVAVQAVNSRQNSPVVIAFAMLQSIPIFVLLWQSFRRGAAQRGKRSSEPSEPGDGTSANLTRQP